MATQTKVIRQIKKALDGRSQRWLALQIRMPETNLSKKLQGERNFTFADITAINKALKSNIQLN